MTHFYVCTFTKIPNWHVMSAFVAIFTLDNSSKLINSYALTLKRMNRKLDFGSLFSYYANSISFLLKEGQKYFYL